MKVPKERLNFLAERFLLELMGSAVWQSTDFDYAILGGIDSTVLDPLRIPVFNRSVFGRALGRMVDDVRVKAWRDDNRWWHYQIVEEKPNE